MKKLFTLFLLTLLPLMASADAVEIDGIYYNLNLESKTAEVTKNPDKYSGEVIIPETVTYNGIIYGITSIGSSAFAGRNGLTSITIPNSVKTIGDYAFNICNGLTSITIPNSVTSIGSFAFHGCSGLTSVIIGNSVTSIGRSAFYGCSGLTSITIPNSLISIGEGAFSYCSGLTSIIIPNSVTSIGSYAFDGTAWYDNQPDGVVYAGKILYTYKGTMSEDTNINIEEGTLGIAGGAFSGCSGLTSITIPNSVTYIGERAFFRTAWYNNQPDGIVYAGKVLYTYKGTMPEGTIINIEEGTVGIADGAFYNRISLSSVVIPNSVVSIGAYAFSKCSSLSSVVIPNSVVSIGAYAFYECSSLSSVVIPNSVVSIGAYAFEGCSGMNSLIVEEGNSIYDSRDNCNAIIETKTNSLVLGCSSTTIPNSVTSIGTRAFYGCSGLTSITIPNSVTYIGVCAFWGCSGLTSITIPNSVTSIGNSAFSGCSGLTSITIPNSVTSIGNSAFSYCSGLTSITIPNSVTSISGSAFSYCSGLTSITIPNSVTSIGELAFSGCSGLTSIVIPNSVTSIGNSAFSGCSGLTSITIPNSVTSIGNSAFSGCSGLTSITIPNSVVFIEGNTFSGCSTLSSITIPNSVISIGGGAFSGTAWYDNQPDGIIYVGKVLYGYKGTMPDGTNIDIEEGTNSITDGAFSYCSGLTSITIPNSVTSIGGSAFSYCSGLTSIIIPNSVTFVGYNAFNGTAWYNNQPDGFVYAGKVLYTYKGNIPSGNVVVKEGIQSITVEAFSYHYGLTSITFPHSMTMIGGLAFFDCTQLVDIYCYAENPPIVSESSFVMYEVGESKGDGRSFIDQITLHVPASYIDAYKKGVYFSFKEIVPIEEYSLTYMIDGEVYKTYQVAEGAPLSPEPEPTKEGYTFSGWSYIPAVMPAEDVTIMGSFTMDSTEDEINITSAGQTTWCSAYDLDFTDIEGLKAYIASGYHRTKGTIWLTRVKEVPAGEGILLIGDAGDYKVPHKSTTAYYANLMVGTVKAITLNETDGEYTNYYLSSGASGVGFYKVNGSVEIKANRAYLPLLKNTVSGTRGFIGMDFDDDEDGTTGIEVQSSIFNLQSNEVYYNLQGQRVDNPSKGLYIKNGKKIVIK